MKRVFYRSLCAVLCVSMLSAAIPVRVIAEEERRQEELDKKVVAYINSLSKEELRQTLYEVLYDGADWVFERFVREHIDY